MTTFALSISYVFQAAVVFMVLLGVGTLILPLSKSSEWTERAWHLILRYGVGLASSIFITINFGLLGLIRAWTVPPLLVGLAIAGWIKWYRRRQPRIQMPNWSGLRRGEKILLGASLAIWAAIDINILIGALVPDFAQDPLWYHLSVSLQWSLTGTAAAFPYVMPSNYCLGLETIYSVILLFTNEIVCNLLYAQIVWVVLAAMALAAYRQAGFIGGLIVSGFIVPFVAVTAPIIAVNDLAASLIIFLGFMSLVDELQGKRVNFFLVGFLFGSAFAIKMVAMIFCGPIVALWALFSVMRKGIKPLIVPLALIGAAFVIAYTPWAIRGYRYSGIPTFPLLSNVFPIKPEYKDAFAASRRLNNTYPLTPAGLKAAFTDGMPFKIKVLLNSSDVMFWLLLMAGVGLLFHPSRVAKYQGFAILCFYPGFVLMKGWSEVCRYFSIGYPLAAPALALAFVPLATRMKPSFRYFVMGLLITLATATYCKKQYIWANAHTIQWKFLPVVTRDAIHKRCEYAEYGENYMMSERLRALIAPGACVFLADDTHPYHLKRRYIWADDVVRHAFVESWAEKSPDEMRKYLKENDASYVLCINEHHELFNKMQSMKYLERVNTESVQYPTLALYKLK